MANRVALYDVTWGRRYRALNNNDSKNDTKTHLLAKVAKSEKIASGMTNEYIKIIVDDFQSTESTKSTTIVKSGFNYRSYLTSSVYANKFRALFDCGIDSIYSPWTTVQIRYDY
ncbi:hypothetical protein EOM86_00955 [Candidatus Nomurabacteria bacterium]|nr:hypothetical protein [Candidatus Nomurabacteria bacterium]